MRIPNASLGVMAAILLSGCRLFNAPSVECEGDVAVSVAKLPEGLTILWGRSCAMTRIAVVEVNGDRIMWGIQLPEDAPITGPIRYGRIPSNASEWQRAEPLQRGVVYYVDVVRVIGGDGYAASGRSTFTY
jgi:hypothetical protein